MVEARLEGDSDVGTFAGGGSVEGLAVRGGAAAGRALRDGAAGEGPRAVRDRLRAERAAAYRHLRRGGADDDDPPRVRGDLGRSRRGCICFSDDMDGMRKVPENVPNQAMLRANLQRPLTSVPDPFGEYESFGAHNNAMLRRFLDTFGFEYEFVSATDFYRSGRFDAVLRRAAERYDAMMEVMLADACARSGSRPIRSSCRSRRRSGRVLYVPLKEVNAADGTITFDDEDGEETDAAGHRRQRQAAVEARFRRALGGARRRLRDVRQGSLDQHADLRPRSARSSAGGRRSISPTSSSSTRTARRSRSRRATG